MRCLSLLLLILLSQLSWSIEEHEFVFDHPRQQSQYLELTKILRCPKCQNNNVADSNADLAIDFRKKIYQLVKEGQNKEQVVAYFVQRYGDFVNYDTRLNAKTIWLWLLPILMLIAAFSFIIVRAKRTEHSDGELTDGEQKQLDTILKGYQ